MRKRLALLAVWSIGPWALAAAGCDGSGGAIPFNQFEPSALAAICRLQVLCHAYPDQATCLSSVQPEPHLYETLGQDITAGRVIYDGASARTCIDAINAISSCSRGAFASIDASPACSKVTTGTVATGGACFFGQECAVLGTCVATTSCAAGQCCAGTCQAGAVSAQLGQSCTGGLAVCVTGTVCVADTSTGTATCQNPIGAGGACTDSTVCAPGLYCDPTGLTCQALVATGGACDPVLDSQDCENEEDHCAATSDGTPATCQSSLAVGSPCVNSTQSCVSYAPCDATSGTCLERPAVGAACTTSGPSCLAGTCDATSGTCVLMSTAGACS